MLNVIVIDSQPLVRMALQVVLNRNGYTLLAEADNGGDGLELVYTHRPGLVILDVHLPGGMGLELMEKIYSFDKNIKILMLTSCSGVHYFYRSKAANASAFLSKMCGIEELERTVVMLMKSHSQVSVECTSPSDTGARVSESLLIRSLSNRELMTFQMLAEGMRNNEIAGILGLSSKTISTYKARLLIKLNTYSPVDLLEMARRNGLVR